MPNRGEVWMVDLGLAQMDIIETGVAAGVFTVVEPVSDIATMTQLLQSLGAEVASLQDGLVLAMSSHDISNHVADYDSPEEADDAAATYIHAMQPVLNALPSTATQPAS